MTKNKLKVFNLNFILQRIFNKPEDKFYFSKRKLINIPFFRKRMNESDGIFYWNFWSLWTIPGMIPKNNYLNTPRSICALKQWWGVTFSELLAIIGNPTPTGVARAFVTQCMSWFCCLSQSSSTCQLFQCVAEIAATFQKLLKKA